MSTQEDRDRLAENDPYVRLSEALAAEVTRLTQDNEHLRHNLEVTQANKLGWMRKSDAHAEDADALRQENARFKGVTAGLEKGARELRNNNTNDSDEMADCYEDCVRALKRAAEAQST